MNTPTHDFVTVEMRGLKAALVARARAERVGVSVVVRRAVAHELGLASAPECHESAQRVATARGLFVKLSIRLTTAEALQLDDSARRAGLSRGAFVAGLLANVPALSAASASLPDCLAALTASSAELSTLSRNINHLTVLLRQGEVKAAQEYRRMLDTLGAHVHAHLTLASRVLADLRPSHSCKRSHEPRRAVS